MELLKKFFIDEDRIIGLSGFKKVLEKKINSFVPTFDPAKPLFNPNYKKNFFLY